MSFFYKTSIVVISLSAVAYAKPDFKSMQGQERQTAFINYMLPAIESADKTICQQRSEVIYLQQQFEQNKQLSRSQQAQLNVLGKDYDVNVSQPNDPTFSMLMERVDILPTSFVLAQAIIESGWGTSNFAVQANNYFGLHCFTPDCGMQASGAKNVFVATFKDVNDNVLGYYNDINTGGTYQQLRDIRAQERKANQPLNADKLFVGLGNYSQLQGNQYEQILGKAVSDYNLSQYDKDTPSCP